MKFVELLRVIGQKPAFYLSPEPRASSCSIWHLRSFLVGFQCGRISTDDDSVLDTFTFWVCAHYGVPDGAMDWCGHIWHQAGKNEEAAFRLFFELFELYLKDREANGSESIKARFMTMLQEHTH